LIVLKIGRASWVDFLKSCGDEILNYKKAQIQPAYKPLFPAWRGLPLHGT
jgi:hypothetical protein